MGTDVIEAQTPDAGPGKDNVAATPSANDAHEANNEQSSAPSTSATSTNARATSTRFGQARHFGPTCSATSTNARSTSAPSAAVKGEQRILQLKAPIDRVVVYEDRAQLTRKGTIHLETGCHPIEVLDVTPLASDRSLRIQVSSAGVRIGDSRVLRSRVARDVSAEIDHLHKEEKRLEADILEVDQELDRLKRLIELRQRHLQDLQRRWAVAASEGLEVSAFCEKVTEIMAGLEEHSGLLRAARNRRAVLKRDLHLLRGRLEHVRRPPTVYSARFRTRIEVDEPGDYEISWSYAVPCALWRPEHQARMKDQGDSSEIEFATQAVVWQATDEDWSDVALVCSTARPGRASDPPMLEDEVLSARRKTAQERREVVAEIREEEIQQAGLGGAREISDMPGIDDGGDSRGWPVESRVSVPSDGRPVRLPLLRWTASARVKHICVPEVLQQVVLRATLENSGARPVLAGPVVLHRSAGFAGRTSVGFVAPGERFELSFGSEDSIRVHRDRSVTREETRLTGYQTLTVSTSLAMSNLSERETEFEITERVPVSELEEIRIQLNDDSPARADGDGLVTWSETLPPRGHSTREFVYRVEAPARVKLPI